MSQVQRRSRHLLTRAIRGADGAVTLTLREPFRFRFDSRNRPHKVQPGDTLWSLAEKFFGSFADAASLWWIIADFQNPPILDPTIRLVPDTILVIPPEDILLEVFSDSRRDTEVLA